METLKVSQLKPNPKNPRTIKGDKFEKLKASIQSFPEMLEKRPIVVADGVVLGGNMRFLAAKAIGLKEVPVIDASEWTQAQRDEFIIKDNVSFGDWDWDNLANEWEPVELGEWGLEVWQPETEVDLSILDEMEDVDGMAEDVRRAICIDFNQDDYAVASMKVAALKKEGKDVGKLMLGWLQTI